MWASLGTPLECLRGDHISHGYVAGTLMTCVPWNKNCAGEGGEYPRRLLDGFNKALDNCQLDDLAVEGGQFTWERSRGKPDWVKERLDRALATVDWMSNFADYQVISIPSVSSDHCALLLLPVKLAFRSRTYHFRFENAWLEEEEDCKRVVEEGWGRDRELGVQGKIELCAKLLGAWGKDKLREYDGRIEKSRKDIVKYSEGTDGFSVTRHREALCDYMKLLKQKDEYWRQHAKTH